MNQHHNNKEYKMKKVQTNSSLEKDLKGKQPNAISVGITVGT
jgi:hypothetical protein